MDSSYLAPSLIIYRAPSATLDALVPRKDQRFARIIGAVDGTAAVIYNQRICNLAGLPAPVCISLYGDCISGIVLIEISRRNQTTALFGVSANIKHSICHAPSTGLCVMSGLWRM
jgi:hypothetical protein